MKTRTVYEIWYEGYQGKRSHWGARESREQAEQEMARRLEWAKGKGYDLPHWIEEKEAEDWPVPSKDLPSDRYFVNTEKVKNAPGTWDSTLVEVRRWVDRTKESSELVGAYTRHYSMLGTFHPFRQLQGEKWHDYALVSPDYTRTSVMDLETGQIVAHEPWPVAEKDIGSSIKAGEEMPGWGFCPVDFYVPDWWELNDESVLPGSHFWGEDDKRPNGQFGFVAGCVWGDDSSWKIRYIDLSQVADGKLTVDDRFGYIELPRRVDLKDAIDYDSETDMVRLAVSLSWHRDGRKGWRAEE